MFAFFLFLCTQGYISRATDERRVLIVNKSSKPQSIVFPLTQDATAYTIDEATGDGPARKELLTSTTVKLAPFAVTVLVLSA